MTQHPELHLIDVRCSSCGASFTTRSTATKLSVDVCSACHPAYTGREQAAVSGDRIDRFNQRRALATAKPKRTATAGIETKADRSRHGRAQSARPRARPSSRS